MDGEPYVVVGVMPAHFEFPTPWGGRDESRLWAPLVLSREDSARGNHSFGAVARLAVTIAFSKVWVLMAAAMEHIA